MGKIILPVIMLTSTAFIGCSDSDDSSENSCKTCETTISSITTVYEYCDKGDGTMDLTTSDTTINIDLGGGSYEDYISSIEFLGTCN